MYYITNSKSIIREYLDISEFIRKEELIAIQFYQIHCKGYMLRGLPLRKL